MNSMDLQRIHIKLLTNASQNLKLEPFIDIFARWREDKKHPAGWVDLADYAHVPKGPGIVLVGYQASVAFDMAAPVPGILYMTRNGLEGASEVRIRSALRSGFETGKKLLAEKEFPAGVELNTGALEVRFADRLETPNTPAIDAELQPAITEALNGLYGALEYEMTREADTRQVYGYSVRAKQDETIESLLERLR
jgi:hypothetical protein